ncbi:MAG: Xaa-Pro peptidase family protein [Thermoflexales bacterium]
MSIINRVERLAARQRDAALDYIALVPGPNMLYFTGAPMLHVSERPTVALLPAAADARPVVFLPGFEAGKFVAGSALNWEAHPYEDGVDYRAAFAAALSEIAAFGRPIRIGVEPVGARFLEIDLLTHALPKATLVSAATQIDAMRVIKDASEVEAMRGAIQLTERVLSECLEEIRPGMTERQVGRMLNERASRLGARSGFAALIQTGHSAAFPHGEAGDRVLQKGEMLLMDFGFYVGDYPSDITRTVAIGEPSARMREIYAVVQAANAAGRAAVRPGVRCEEVDSAARAVIEAAGFGKYFSHRTGHGLGLEIHEPPYMVRGNKQVIEPGMVFTIEPGIYIEGLGGVRIEDNVVVTATGGESLTTFTRDLLVLGDD